MIRSRASSVSQFEDSRSATTPPHFELASDVCASWHLNGWHCKLLTNKRSIQRFSVFFLNVLSTFSLNKYIQMSDSKETVAL